MNDFERNLNAVAKFLLMIGLFAFLVYSFTRASEHDEDIRKDRASFESQIAHNPTPAARYVPVVKPLPKFDWVGKESVLSMDALSLRTMTIPIADVDRKLQIEIEAEQSVSFAFADTMSWDERTKPATINFNGMTCAAVEVLSNKTVCEIPAGSMFTFLLRDNRSAGTVAAGALGILTRNNNAINRATAPNRVKIALRQWSCIENCS